jgi:hypothetical protein
MTGIQNIWKVEILLLWHQNTTTMINL